MNTLNTLDMEFGLRTLHCTYELAQLYGHCCKYFMWTVNVLCGQ